MIENCKYHTDHDNRIRRLENETHELNERISAQERHDAVVSERMTTALDQLAKLPDAIHALNDSTIALARRVDGMQHDINEIKDDLNTVRTKINTIDDESKFNIRKWFKDNWISLAVGLSGLIALGVSVAKGLFQ